MWRRRSSRRKRGKSRKRRSPACGSYNDLLHVQCPPLFLGRRLFGFFEKRAFQLLVNLKELVDPMGAGVPLQNRPASVKRQGAPLLLVLQQHLQMPLQLLAVARDQEIGPRREEPLAVLPGGGDQRNAAGKGLKRPDRRDAGERFDVRPPRDVDGGAEPGEDGGNLIIRKPAPVSDSRPRQRRARLLRVADAEDFGLQSERPRRLQEKAVELGGPLLVSPITDPDEVAPLLGCGDRP